jgi:hypothetical protein
VNITITRAQRTAIAAAVLVGPAYVLRTKQHNYIQTLYALERKGIVVGGACWVLTAFGESVLQAIRGGRL